MTKSFELDLRPILRDGGEPFGVIMEAVNGLKPGQSLKLFATFRPEPLLTAMSNKGFTYEASAIEGGDWQVVFTPARLAKEAAASSAIDAETWADPAYYLDCTELDPPEPMVQILARLETMAEGDVLLALLGREPLFLFPELQMRGHAWVGDFDADGTDYRLLVRAGSQN